MNAKLIADKTLKELRYDFRTFSIQGFISYIGEMKRREIITIPWAMPATIFGAWMSDDEEPKEYIFYRDNVPTIHQVHIQLHELSHLLLGHPTLRINRKKIAEVFEEKASLPFADLPRLRSPKQTECETQAEVLATLIQERVIQNSHMDQLLNDLSSEEKLSNFLNTMGLS
jgi:hypothetical protein